MTSSFLACCLQLLKEAVEADEPVIACDDMDEGARYAAGSRVLC